MPTAITESSVFTPSLQVPNNTEAADQASLLIFLQGLTNRSRFLFDLTKGFRVVTSYDSNITITPVTFNVIDAVTLTASRTYTFDDTGVTDGMFYFIRNRQSGYRITINHQGGAQLDILDWGDWVLLIRTAGVWRTFFQSRSVRDSEITLPLPTTNYSTSHLTFSPTTGWTQTTTGGAFSGSYLYLPVAGLPIGDSATGGNRLRTAYVRVIGATGHGGLPATMPGFRVLGMGAAGLVDLSGAVLDASPDLATYEDEHDIVYTLSPTVPVGPTGYHNFFFAFFGEYGANAITGLKVMGHRVDLHSL